MYDKENISEEQQNKGGLALLAAWWAIGTVITLIAIKSYAYYITDSISVLGTLTDSISDLAISAMMLMAIRYALQPADEEHRYGHGKMEGIATLFQAAFLSGAAVFLILSALQRLTSPQEIESPVIAIVICAISIILSLVLVLVQSFVVKKSGSLAVEADKSHYSSDVVLNSGVIIALLIQTYNGPVYTDSIIGLMIATYILYTAYGIGKKGTDMLMDRELPDKDRRAITDIVENHPQMISMHDLRTRRMGMDVHISFDVEMNGALSLREAHDYVRELEISIIQLFPNADIIIHMDPEGDIYDARHKVHGVHH